MLGFVYFNGSGRAADRVERAAKKVGPFLKKRSEALGARVGNPVFIRIFKESRELELWIQKTGKREFVLFQRYPIAAMSGDLGPKLKEGDRQAPEGFYYVTRQRMNPQSNYHLAFNIGYPNAYDKAYGRTGSFIMVHGNRVSVGCYAMTDAKIKEIYTLCDAALRGGQRFFRVHSFPFRMTAERMAQARQSQWYAFWQNLQQGYTAFETTKRPPNVKVKGDVYVVE